jgi:hypothetical protein
MVVSAAVSEASAEVYILLSLDVRLAGLNASDNLINDAIDAGPDIRLLIKHLHQILIMLLTICFDAAAGIVEADFLAEQ